MERDPPDTTPSDLYFRHTLQPWANPVRLSTDTRLGHVDVPPVLHLGFRDDSRNTKGPRLLRSGIAREKTGKIGFEITDAAKDLLMEEGYDSTYGARPLKRTIQKKLENPLAQKILSGEFTEGDHIHIDAQRHSFIFNKNNAS